MAPFSDPVIIIGGGIAGLACAFQLQKNNIPYLLLEKNAEVGGKIRTDVVEGFLCDKGFQVYFEKYPSFKKIISVKDLKLKKFIAGTIIRKGGKFHTVADPLRHPRYAFNSLFSQLFTLKDKWKLFTLAYCYSPESNLPTLTTHQFLEAYGFSEKSISSFFRPFFGGVFLEDKLVTNAGKFQTVFQYFLKSNVSVPLYGMQCIPLLMKQQLEQENILTDNAVISVSDDSVKCSDGSILKYRHLVFTDALEAERLIGKKIRSYGVSIKEVATHSVSSIYFAAKDVPAPLKKPILFLNAEKRDSNDINHLCNIAAVCPAYSSEGYNLISITILGNNLEKEQLVENTKLTLAEWFGETTKTWKYIKSYHIRNALPVEETPFNELTVHYDNYSLCGDFIAGGSSEQAAASGLTCGNEIADKLKSGLSAQL